MQKTKKKKINKVIDICLRKRNVNRQRLEQNKKQNKTDENLNKFIQKNGNTQTRRRNFEKKKVTTRDQQKLKYKKNVEK